MVGIYIFKVATASMTTFDYDYLQKGGINSI